MHGTDHRAAQWVPAMPTADEDTRLEELYALDALNIANDRLDSYTGLCARIFQVPIAFVSLLTVDKQWFKSSVGMDISGCQREMSFCGHTIHHDLLVIPDSWADPRFRDNPLVTGSPHIRSYAGATIRGRDGSPLGSLCLVDHRPRDFSEDDRRILVDMAALVREEILRYRESRTKHEDLVAEAMTDPVTGLASARLLRDRLDQAIRQARQTGDRVAVFVAELDRFQELVRARGSATGNAVLKAVADRLRAHLPSGFTLGRQARKTFVLFAPLDRDLSDVTLAARQIFAAVEAPFTIDGEALKLDVCVGGAVFPDDGETRDRLLERAEHAADERATPGAAGIALYSPDLNRVAAERFDLERRLRLALDEGRLELAYQPKIAVTGQRVVGAEALLRWHDPDLGWVSPGTFVPLAERVGLIGAIGAFVLQRACAEAATWAPDGADARHVAVNVSAIQMRSPAFPELVRETLATTGLAPARLVLEMTESTLMKESETVIANMRALAGDGVAFALDDFGTGYSSFSYLQRLPLASVKIDRSFVRPIVDDEGSARIVHGIVALAKHLGLTVTAEGVETAEQALFLKAYGADEYQGFHFSKPLPAETFRALL